MWNIRQLPLVRHAEGVVGIVEVDSSTSQVFFSNLTHTLDIGIQQETNNSIPAIFQYESIKYYPIETSANKPIYSYLNRVTDDVTAIVMFSPMNAYKLFFFINKVVPGPNSQYF